jgi:hypothetical protein
LAEKNSEKPSGHGVEEKKTKKSDYGNAIIAAVFVIVLIAAFLFVRGMKPNEKEYDFQGIRVVCVACGGDAQAALHAALAKPKILIREELVSGNSSKNTVVAIAAAQIARNFLALNKTAYAFGVVDGTPSIECNDFTDNCSHESIQVAIGSCNCLRIDAAGADGAGVVRVEGTEEWFKENGYGRVMTIASVIGGAVS